ncbi:MAG: methionine--tRNA ligase [Gemmatimonadetes bacterium]|nr:methionine--tRNA ligase [Gemmatimonadota bacterium]
MKPWYITTAIDYANGDPHLGHALEKIGADALARWHRLQGQPVRFLMGMDEHGQKVFQSAQAAGLSPQAWVDGISAHFEQTWRSLHCAHDDWMRTTEPRHAAGVQALLERIRERHPEDLFVGEYEGLYCVGCEEFKQEGQLVDGRCPEHPSRDLVRTKEKNTFFRLSAYRDRVLALVEANDAFRVEPQIRRNEILSTLREGLQDISISRARLPWGIPFPGTDDETVYVWFDALINYLSATGYPNDGWDAIWPADLHVVGKGITRFHCIIWPAMLLAAELPLPKAIWAHGYVQWGGAKVSKSEGSSVTIAEAADRHGADALRWFLLREVGFEHDGDFTFERFDAVYESELANGLGNLASRVLAMVEKYRDGVVPIAAPSPLPVADAAVADYASAMTANDLKGAAKLVVDVVTEANGYITVAAPWALAKGGQEAELDVVLATLATTLLRLAVMTFPFMPEKATALWSALGQDGAPEAAWENAKRPALGGASVRKPENLFPRLA